MRAPGSTPCASDPQDRGGRDPRWSGRERADRERAVSEWVWEVQQSIRNEDLGHRILRLVADVGGTVTVLVQDFGRYVREERTLSTVESDCRSSPFLRHSAQRRNIYGRSRGVPPAQLRRIATRVYVTPSRCSHELPTPVRDLVPGPRYDADTAQLTRSRPCIPSLPPRIRTFDLTMTATSSIAMSTARLYKEL